MASLSNSTDVYADKLYLSLGEVGIVDLAETVAAKAEKAETYTISVIDMILDDTVDDVEFSVLGSIVSSKANSADVYTKAEITASAQSTTLHEVTTVHALLLIDRQRPNPMAPTVKRKHWRAVNPTQK